MSSAPEPRQRARRLVPVVDPMDYGHELSDVRQDERDPVEWLEAQFEARYAQMLRRGVVGPS